MLHVDDPFNRVARQIVYRRQLIHDRDRRERALGNSASGHEQMMDSECVQLVISLVVRFPNSRIAVHCGG
jgi:hypothetical protein